MPDPTRVRPALVELTSARMKEFVREPEALFWVFGFPLLLALCLGLAFRDKAPDRILVGIVAGPHAQERLAALEKSPALQAKIFQPGDAAKALERGKISLLVSGDGKVVYQFDPTRPDARTARVEVDDALQQASGRRDVFLASEEHVRKQGARYIDFLIPGLLGMNLMGTGMWGTGFTIVNARMKKLLKRLIATPMRKSQYMLAQFLSRLVWLVIEVIVLVAFAWIVFGVRVNGSLLLLGGLCIAGGFSFSGIGLLAASRARTIEAASGIMNLVMMPMWLCSGVFFSYERFPDKVKPLIRALPLTALNDALRGVMNDAATLSQVAPQLALLAAWGIVCFFLGLRVFRWQ